MCIIPVVGKGDRGVGYIGNDAKAERHLLLDHLSGSSAFPTMEAARKHSEEIDEKQIAGLDADLQKAVQGELAEFGYDVNRLNSGRKLVLITGHRRENFGEGFLNICHAIKSLAERYPDTDFVYPVHLNPNVRKPVFEILGDGAEKNIFLIEPLQYLPFVYMMERSYLILTDSGGVQEEAPGLGKPVLVMRNTTERPEAVEAGTVMLVGTDRAKIEQGVIDLMEKPYVYRKMSEAVNPYGDGLASKRISSFLANL